VFNWAIWPDFTEIPSPQAPFMRFSELALGRPEVLGARRIAPVAAVHTVPAVGYHLDSGNGSLVFSGDTGVNEGLWKTVNAISNLKYLVIETAFSNK